jgi:acyl-CoA oxidase
MCVFVAACTIAIRYGAVRRQGFIDEKEGQELQVLDYPTQQFRLLPLLASAFAFHFMGRRLASSIRETEASLKTMSGPELAARMARTHAATSGLKSLCTRIAADGIEDCRKCCGGHGYLLASGLPEIMCDFLQQCTVEGDNWVICQQTTGHLLKVAMDLMEGRPASPECQYLCRAKDLELGFGGGKNHREHGTLLRLYAIRSLRLLETLGHKLAALTGEGKSKAEASRAISVDSVAVSR